jgi:hypothetical protein
VPAPGGKTRTASERLVGALPISQQEAEIVYDGLGEPAWNAAGAVAKNGQRVVRLSKLRALAAGRDLAS